MSDKPVAGLVAAMVVGPLMAICCLGPILYASFAAGLFSWFSGIPPLRIALVMGIVAAAAFFLIRWRKRLRADTNTMRELS